MNIERYYQIANLVFKICYEAKYEFIAADPYKDYVINKKVEDFCLECFLVIDFPEYQGDLIYQNRQNKIYVDDCYLYRHIGSFSDYDGEQRSFVVVSLKNDPINYQVYIRTNENKLLERDLFNAMGLDILLAIHSKVILHASYITYQNQGILFSAPSGTGKSTQAELWSNHIPNVTIINGDRAILSVNNDKVIVDSLPFCGLSKIALNQQYPLKAIIVLRQGKVNQLSRISGVEAIRLLMMESSVNLWDKNLLMNIIDTLKLVVEMVPIYYFSCLPNIDAVEMVKEELFV